MEISKGLHKVIPYNNFNEYTNLCSFSFAYSNFSSCLAYGRNEVADVALSNLESYD